MTNGDEFLRQRILELENKCDAESTAREASDAARKASDARVKELIDRESASTTQQPRTHGQEQQDYRSHTGTSLIMSQNRVPSCDCKKVHLWSGRFQSFLAARNLISVLEPTPG